MASVFDTWKQASGHARSVLAKYDNDPAHPEVQKEIDKIAYYPAPYRSAFKQTIKEREEYLTRRANFKSPDKKSSRRFDKD